MASREALRLCRASSFRAAASHLCDEGSIVKTHRPSRAMRASEVLPTPLPPLMTRAPRLPPLIHVAIVALARELPMKDSISVGRSSSQMPADIDQESRVCPIDPET